MKTLYFPTTSANFENILSTESISPSLFYKKRNYGIPHWRHLADYSLSEQTLTLFKEAGFFELDMNIEEESFPILVEMQLHDFNERYFKKHGIDAEGKPIESINDWCLIEYPRTIFLESDSTSFYFSNKEEKDIVKIKLEGLLLAKNCNKYKLIDGFPDSSKDYPKIRSSQEQSYDKNVVIEEELKKERKYDSLKGIHYCYIYSNTINENYIKFENNLRDNNLEVIRDMVKSELKKYNPQLMNVFERIKKWKDMSDEEKYFRNIVEEFIAKHKHWKLIIDKEKMNNHNALEDAEEFMKKQFAKEAIIILNKMKPIRWYEVNFKNSAKMIDEKFNDDCFVLIFSTMHEKLRDERGEMTKEKKKKLITMIGQKINIKYGMESKEREYLAKVFEFFVNEKGSIEELEKTIKSNSIKSLFYFLIKPNKIEELMTLLISKNCNIYSVRMCLIYWGAYHGYASIPKLYTDFISGNKEITEKIDSYLKNIIKKIWKSDRKTASRTKTRNSNPALADESGIQSRLFCCQIPDKLE